MKTLSDFREREFGPAYGVLIKTGALAGLTHVEYVKEIASEPDYAAALAAARKAAGA